MEKPQNLISKKRDWSHLSSDLVYLIAKKLPRLLDYIHVHFTCKNWCSSTSLFDFPMHFPWLLEFHQKTDDFISVPTTRLCLYSISSGETLTIPVKESSWHKGSPNNYLPFVNNHTGAISLFNPLTNDEFATPFIHDQYKLFSSHVVGTGSGHIRDRRILIIDYRKYPGGVDQWAIYDPDDERWREQKGFCAPYCYCQGLLFHSAYRDSETKVFDLSKKLLYTIPPHEDDIRDAFRKMRLHYRLVFKSYVVVSSGEIWRVHWYYEANILMKLFTIYRLCFEGDSRQPRWVKITDNIGDEIIFLEMTNGIVNGFSVTAASTNGSRGGYIYFIDPYSEKPYVYDFVSNTVAAVPCPFEKCTWFLPALG